MFTPRRLYLGLLLLFCLILSACGPSPEEQAATAAAQTAAAATSTPTITPSPTPTPTPTPVPYNLTVVVTGADGLPIKGAKVYLEEIDDIENSDEDGQSSWVDLPGKSITLNVSAQGYFSVDLIDSIERGTNLINISLERDPFGLLASDVCLDGEQVLYIEDFQDQQAQGWTEIEFRAQDWDIISHPDNPGNFTVSRLSTYEGCSSLKRKFTDAVWRFKIMHVGKPVSNYTWHWHVKESGDWSAYPIWNHFPDIHVNRVDNPHSEVALRWTPFVLKPDVWQQIEVSTYEGRFELWIDGVPWVQYDDPEPLPGGGINICVGLGHDPENTSRVYFDDFAVCGLSEPVQPLPTSISE